MIPIAVSGNHVIEVLNSTSKGAPTAIAVGLMLAVVAAAGWPGVVYGQESGPQLDAPDLGDPDLGTPDSTEQPPSPPQQPQQPQPQQPQPQQPQPQPAPPTAPDDDDRWDGKTVVDVEVQGTRRIEVDTVLQQIETGPGDVIERRQISEDIHRVHELGYFDDIRVEAESVDDDRVILTFVVEEKPAIDAINFVGLDELDEDDIEEVVDLERFSILDTAQVNRAAEAIRDLYRDEGHFLAEVDFEISTREDRPDLAVITFQIQEYSEVQVKRVTFLGNEAIPERELRGVMATREGNFLSFFTEMGSFQEENFEEDLQRLMAYYYDHGYVQVQVGMPTLRLSPDKRHLYITVRIEEGAQHFTGDVDIQGDLLDDRENLLAMTSIGDEEVFRYSRMQQDLMQLQRFYQDAGYANAQIRPLTDIDAESQRVDVTFDINQGQKVRIGRIEVVGNTSTRDQVIRRELAIEEGHWYSASSIERSQQRIQRLGFFEGVDVTSQQTDRPDVVDLQVQVEERPTGTFQLGAGLSSQESFIFQGQVSQENLFGRGQSLQLSAQISAIRTMFNLRFSEPWLFGTRWNFATDLYNFDFLYQDFARRSTGGTLTLGYPIGEFFGWPMGDALRASLRYKLEDVNVRPGGIRGGQAEPSSPLFQGGLTSSVRAGMTYDTRDDQMFPTQGGYHSGTVEVADSALGSQNEFVKLDGDVRGYVPLFWNLVMRLNASGGYIASTSLDRPAPIFERYFAGGPETVRGFNRFTLGPSRRVASVSNDPAGRLERFHYGGNKKLVLTAELEFPILAAAQLRGVIFADAGNAFDDGQPFTLRPDLVADDEEMYADALRTSVGFGVRWFSPIGPLRFEWGFPLQRLPDEDPVVFDFSIQQAF